MMKKKIEEDELKVFKSFHPTKGAQSFSALNRTMKKDFRKALSSKAPVPRGEHVLVAYSGGHSSTALLGLLEESVPKDPLLLQRRKNMSFLYSCVFVDLSSFFEVSYSRKEVEETVVGYFKNVKKIHFVEIPSEQVKKILQIKDTSEKEEMLNETVKRTILEFAKKNNFKTVILGTSATRLAINTISSICIGQANRISSQVLLENDIHDVRVIQPMKSFYVKELVFYNRMKKIPEFFTSTFSTLLNPKRSSVEKIVEKYIHKCQKNKSDTTFTILRICEKLKVDKSEG